MPWDSEWDWDGGWPRYPKATVAEQRERAAQAIAELREEGVPICPVVIQGNAIARTFWGKAWCLNLESYSDYRNRLPRGRTYVRSGAVVDLRIDPGVVKAVVAGSELYNVTIRVGPLKRQVWQRIKAECFGKIDSLLELLQGQISRTVMDIVTRRPDGLFPAPAEITMSCSCPDSARMCKHVAATLYGVGTRLDERPELFFSLRKVNHMELIGSTESAHEVRKSKKRAGTLLDPTQLTDIFGVEIAEPNPKKRRKRRPGS